MPQSKADESRERARIKSEILFPNNIKNKRLARGLTQEGLGKLLDPPMVVSTVSKIESGERRLSNLQIANFAEILGCPPEQIPVVTGRDKPADVRRWRDAQQTAIQQSVETGAAAVSYVLAQLRKKNGKTMQQVGDAIGLTISVYHRIEMATRMIQEGEIKALAAFYEMPQVKLIKLFERRTRENREQLENGVPPEELLPRFPRSLLKEDAKWGQLGALERYALRRSLRVVASGRRHVPLPVYGDTKVDAARQERVFVIDRDSSIDAIQPEQLFPVREDCFLVRNHSNRLGFLMRAGALAFVDPAATVAVGDIVFFVRDDRTADPELVVGDGLGPMRLKMFAPEEEVTMTDPKITAVYRVAGVIFPR
jgi:transcriptional regulator with XRE-family HTH domain